MGVKNRQFYVYLLAGILILDFILFGYAPSIQRLKNLKQSQSHHHKIINNSRIQRQNLIELRNQMKGLDDALARWKDKIPSDREVGRFVQTVAKLMSMYGLAEQRVAPGPECKYEKLGAIPVTLKCRGDLEQLFGFYQDLQECVRLIRVQRVHLNYLEQVPKGIEMTTEIILYYGSPEV